MDLSNLPKLATDSVAVNVDETGNPRVGIIRRPFGANAGKLSLPGVLIQNGELAEDAAKRALSKLDGVDAEAAVWLTNLTFAGNPDRDPRGDTRSQPIAWVIGGVAPSEFISLEEVPELAFDHNDIVDDFRKVIGKRFFEPEILVPLLGNQFTTGKARNLYRALTGSDEDPGNFNRSLRKVFTGVTSGRTTIWTAK